MSERFSGGIVTQSREYGYSSARHRRRFTFTGQSATPDTYIGRTSFGATTPFLLFRKSASNFRHVLSKLELSQASALAGSNITIAIAISNADKYASGGTLVGAASHHSDGYSDAPNDLTCYHNPTGAAWSSDTKWLRAYEVLATLGTTILLDEKDGIILGSTGSLLVYAYATTTAPTLRVNATWIEE